MMQNVLRIRRIGLKAVTCMVIGAALSACQPQPAPAVTRVDPDAQLQAFLVSVYGAQATSKSPWHAPVEAGANAADTIQRSLCARQAVTLAGVSHLLLAVCGEDPAGGHAAPGLIDFYVLKPHGNRLVVAASARDQGFGSSGRPGTVSVLRLGRNFYGFRVEGTWVGQGYVLGTQSLVVAKGATLVTAADIRSTISNEGAIDCEQDADCANRMVALEFDLIVDSSNAAAKLYPLLIREHGRECGQTVQREHRLIFDAVAWRYPVPDALMREGCISNLSDAGEASQ